MLTFRDERFPLSRGRVTSRDLLKVGMLGSSAFGLSELTLPDLQRNGRAPHETSQELILESYPPEASRTFDSIAPWPNHTPYFSVRTEFHLKSNKRKPHAFFGGPEPV